MDEPIQFRFTIQDLPDGAALTGSEIEQRLLETLRETDGQDLAALWKLAVLYQRTGHLDESSGCIEEMLERTSNPEECG